MGAAFLAAAASVTLWPLSFPYDLFGHEAVAPSRTRTGSLIKVTGVRLH